MGGRERDGDGPCRDIDDGDSTERSRQGADSVRFRVVDPSASAVSGHDAAKTSAAATVKALVLFAADARIVSSGPNRANSCRVKTTKDDTAGDLHSWYGIETDDNEDSGDEDDQASPSRSSNSARTARNDDCKVWRSAYAGS